MSILAIKRRHGPILSAGTFSQMMTLLYLAVIARQYFWSWNGASIWLVSAAAATIVLVALSAGDSREDLQGHGIDWQFGFWILIPLAAVYLLRLPFPDESWDIINYHYLNGERAVRGYPFIDGDFLYLIYSNPIGDMITTVFRHALGHRLGTVVNLLAVVWAAVVLNEILKRIVDARSWRIFLCLALVLFEGVTYEIGNYWIDFLAVPLLLKLVYLLAFDERKTTRKFLHAALLMGMAVGLKLTNLYFVIPASILLVQQALGHARRWTSFALLALGGVTLFALPLIPYHSYIYLETGNPIYPHFNWIFRSGLASLEKVGDDTLGPDGFLESIAWPMVMLFKSDRLSPTPVYPIFTSAAYFLSIAFLVASVRGKLSLPDGQIRRLCLLFVCFAFIWGVVSGDFRYVVALELMGGLVLIGIFKSWGLWERPLFKATVALLILAKTVFSIDRGLQYEWAGRPTYFTAPSLYKSELHQVLRDRHLPDYLDDSARSRIRQAEVWLSSSPVVSGYMVLLNPDIPYVDLHHLPRRGALGPAKFQATVDSLGPRRYFSLIKEGTLDLDLDWSIHELEKQGFAPVQFQMLTIPFFSTASAFSHQFVLVEAVPRKYMSRLAERRSEAVISQQKSTLVHPKWLDGCSSIEGGVQDAWRWCDRKFSFELVNYSDVEQFVDLSFTARTGHPDASTLHVHGPGFDDRIQVDSAGSTYRKRVRIDPQGRARMDLDTDAARVPAPQDPRALFVRLSDFSIHSSMEDKANK